jgi:ribonuclease VapC
MVVDTSALVALLMGEADAARVATALESADVSVVSAPTLVEASIVVHARLGADGLIDLDRIIAEAGIVVVDFEERDARTAADAWRRYGKGRHPAGLNLGDCYSYALAHRRSEPLLFVGDDFGRTDAIPA